MKQVVINLDDKELINDLEKIRQRIINIKGFNPPDEVVFKVALAFAASNLWVETS